MGIIIRFTLAQGGVDFEDVNAPHPPTPEVKANWQKLGGNLTTNVPMLELPDGKTYTQSSAVLRWAARKGGLMPEDPEQAYLVDNLIAACDDYRSETYKVVFATMGGKATPEMYTEFKAKLAVHFKNFERLLGDNTWFVGDKVTVADMTMLDV